MDYMCQNFGKVSRKQELFQLNTDQMAKILASDDLNVHSEEEAYNALVAWARHDIDARNKDIPDLLVHIRLSLLPVEVS